MVCANLEWRTLGDRRKAKGAFAVGLWKEILKRILLG